MRFTDTRDKNVSVSYQEAIFTGLAESGGLYYADRNPDLSKLFASFTPQTSFNEIAAETAAAFLGDELTQSQIGDIVQSAFKFEPKLKRMSNNIISLELFHGPSLSFKDFGASFLAASMEAFLGSQSRRAVILTATSGDTGSAVAQAFYRKANIDVVILYPSGKVSPLQEKQITTLGENIHALEVRGTFDDCQRLVKNAFSNLELKKALNLTSANSINLGRLMAQTFYYIWAYAQMNNGKSENLIFTVPSGNFGNITGGVWAHICGLPVKKFIAAVNANRVFPDYLETGIFNPQPSIATYSNAMDVGNPSNFERLQAIYGSVEKMRAEIESCSVSNQLTVKTIRSTYEKTGYFICPHTAVGIYASANYLKNNDGKIISLATAHPAKFAELIEKTLQKPVPLPLSLKKVQALPKKSEKIDADNEALSAFLSKLK